LNILEKQKIFSGDDLKDIQVIKSVINQIGNALESGFMWVELFKRDHDDTHFYKNAVDDFSFCSLINYRNKHANYITVLQSLMENNKIYDAEKDTSKSFDLDLLNKIATVFPSFVIDSLNKTQNDDDNDVVIKKTLSSSFITQVYSQMLLMNYNNVFITHS